MNVAIDRLMYQSRAAPLEKQLTFDELQNRPLGFQSAIPRDPTGEAMNSLEFKNAEGQMFEAAAYASQPGTPRTCDALCETAQMRPAIVPLNHSRSRALGA